MIVKGLKSGFLALLLVLFAGSGFHTHSEKEFQTFSEPSYSAHQDSKQTPVCPICQFQIETRSAWNPGFLTGNSLPLLQIENRISSEIFIRPFDFFQIQLGRAPPFLLPLS
ncbi:LIC10965 family protein [Leptospira alstonii]|uniref:Uncharacterized protein n=2 Tax=Leptospira alstonii TaxID=28452 RepID=M6D2X3_9LEPT|nr:hypothetical protein [Leptospira alstonii]EMJ97036.1 hypothetical protein LEP1GSC194_4003 [Leptospira alstonii serovar Sichuan str. 79601]EQA80722.1 hypothetical protein LEP1GSC193_3781 [Leptospira alstonii serovar Pingchang str. 80-412]